MKINNSRNIDSENKLFYSHRHRSTGCRHSHLDAHTQRRPRTCRICPNPYLSSVSLSLSRSPFPSEDCKTGLVSIPATLAGMPLTEAKKTRESLSRCPGTAFLADWAPKLNFIEKLLHAVAPKSAPNAQHNTEPR